MRFIGVLLILLMGCATPKDRCVGSCTIDQANLEERLDRLEEVVDSLTVLSHKHTKPR